MRRHKHVVTIVGGGTCSAILATHLLTGRDSGIEVHLIDPVTEPGWSPAPGDTDSGHILNMPAGRMSLYADTPNDFVRWVRRHGPGLGWPQAATANPATYLPRRLYYQYVRSSLADAAARIEAIDGHARFFRHVGQVHRLSPRPDAVTLNIDDGTRVVSDAVVLAPSIRPPAVGFPVTGTSGRFVANPWSRDALAAIGANDRILVVGTGLLTVDVVAALDQAGHKGPLTAISPLGRLPFVRGVAEPHPPILTPEDFADGVAKAIRKVRTAIDDGVADWRTAIDSLRPASDKLWQSLPPVAQDRLMRHFHRFWELHRHRLPADSADMLLRWTSRGQLTVLAGWVVGLTLDATGARLEVRPRGSLDAVHHTADWVLNCAPPAAILDAPRDPLTDFLLGTGIARPNRTGQGFDTDHTGHLVDAAGNPAANIFVLGQPRKGHAFEASLIPTIRPQFETLSSLLASHSQIRRPRRTARRPSGS